MSPPAAHPELLKTKFSHGHDQTIINGISRIGYMSGGKAARWVDEDMADVITRKATGFIEQNRDKPFFLYFSTHDIHVPRAPHARFAGQSGCGARGDVIEQLDWCVGQVLEQLERLKLADDTLVIFTSDNGPVVDDGYADGSVKNLNGHKPAGPLRGGKYSRYEGGTREPFIVRWPGRVAPGVSDALLCQVDLLASFAALLERKLPAEAGPDSYNLLPALLGKSSTGRETLVEQAQALALREGPWKYLEPARRRGQQGAKRTPSQRARTAGNELYNLADDLAESMNLAAERPDVVKRMQQKLDEIRQQGRSRPAP